MMETDFTVEFKCVVDDALKNILADVYAWSVYHNFFWRLLEWLRLQPYHCAEVEAYACLYMIGLEANYVL